MLRSVWFAGHLPVVQEKLLDHTACKGSGYSKIFEINYALQYIVHVAIVLLGG